MLSGDNVWEGLLTTLNGPLLGSIPIIGWAKTLIMAPFMSSISPLPLFSVLLASTLAVVALSIYYAVDFYEESVTVAEWAQAVSKGDMSSLQSSSEKPQKKSKEMDLDWNLKDLGLLHGNRLLETSEVRSLSYSAGISFYCLFLERLSDISVRVFPRSLCSH